jgi:hypothetical protein
MTAQIPDTLEFEQVHWSIAGVRGAGLFDPTAHGLAPRPRITSCWRGFVCRYLLRQGRLLLDGLLVNPSEPPPELFGVLPTPPERGASFGAHYANLGHPVDFNGELLAGNNFLQELYVHMGFHPAWKYQNVHHFWFSHGVLTDHRDRSAEAARFRQQVRRKPELGSLSIGESFMLGFDPWAG